MWAAGRFLPILPHNRELATRNAKFSTAKGQIESHTMKTIPQTFKPSKPWQDWIDENLARGCARAAMLDIMQRDGGMDARHAAMTLDAAAAQSIESDQPRIGRLRPRPDIDSSGNTLQTPDRLVQILMSCNKPRVVLLGNVLSDEECDALFEVKRAQMVRSLVVSNVADSGQLDDARTSVGAAAKLGETELHRRIEARLAFLTNWPADHAEGIQLLQYETGQEYRTHSDCFDRDKPGPARRMLRGGQRVGTVVMYLNDVEDGGGTGFPSIGLKVNPRKGNALFFVNTDQYGFPDKLTKHAGMPVRSGVKRIAVKWLRERPC